jgi:hypothetical protein
LKQVQSQRKNHIGERLTCETCIQDKRCDGHRVDDDNNSSVGNHTAAVFNNFVYDATNIGCCAGNPKKKRNGNDIPAAIPDNKTAV